MFSIAFIGVVVLLAASTLLQAALPVRVPRLGAVASQNSQCTEIGTQMLTRGGNAVDALIATQFCIGTVAMSHAGIGGGGFMVLRTSDGTYEGIDCQVKAPSGAHQDMLDDEPKAGLVGGLASAVPGELKGLEHIHKYAKLAWADLIVPSIRLADEGFQVTADLVSYMRGVRPDNAFLRDTEDTWAEDFVVFDSKLNASRPLQQGDTMTRKRYANTLRKIAVEGARAFYEGDIAEATVRTLQNAKHSKNNKGIITLDDLRNYTIRERKPISIHYRGHKLISLGAPSSGAVTLSVLNILSGYEGLADPASVNISTHRLDEAFRWAFAQRGHLGDPEYVTDAQGYTKEMLSADTAQKIRSRILNDGTFPTQYYDPENLEQIETPGTAHISAADSSGMAVSSTTTIGHWFGSHVMVAETGVVMNSQMSVFSAPSKSHFGPFPNPRNHIQPHKRPLSAISPVIVETPEGKLYAALGAAGKNRIITAVAQSIIHLLDGGMTVAEALAQPRMHDQLNVRNDRIQFEWRNRKLPFRTGSHNSTVEFMQSLGHGVAWVRPGLSSAQGLRLLPNGTFEAAGEPRQLASRGLAV